MRSAVVLYKLFCVFQHETHRSESLELQCYELKFKFSRYSLSLSFLVASLVLFFKSRIKYKKKYVKRTRHYPDGISDL